MQKGLVDCRLENSAGDQSPLETSIEDIGRDLDADWVRLVVLWSRVEPQPGAYDAVEVARLDSLVDGLRARGVRVLMTVGWAPGWAQDRRYAPSAQYPGFVRDDAIDDYGRLGEYLASHFAGRVRGFECWNEPNLWGFIYPQRTPDDEYFAARVYLKLLKAFHAGVRRAGAGARVIAGATAPVGLDDKLRTSPQRFARFLKANGAAAYFDAYSHHPYTPGGTRYHAPGQRPNDPSTTVVLQNLPTLLKLFPGKPFYLTEYGYNTRPSLDFGGFVVDEVTQATYLRQAYAYVRRFRQVKALFWYLNHDVHTAGLPADRGVYTGLRRVDGSRKPSWFAFAGGNRVTVAAPHVARRRSWVRVSGKVTNRAVGAVTGRRLQLQARRLSGGSWNTLKTTDTSKKGRYTFWIRPTTDRSYRVVWPGVKTSSTVRLRVY